MKKYVKPELFYESYELSQHIAACGWDMNSGDPMSCTADGDPDLGNPEIRVFVASNDHCKDATIWEGYCYENSTGNETIKIFVS